MKKEIWDGIMLRHRLVEEAEDKTQVAAGQAYLCHLDRGELIGEVERLQRMRDVELQQMIGCLRERDDKLCTDAAECLDNLRDEAGLWKDRYYSERRDHEASIKWSNQALSQDHA